MRRIKALRQHDAMLCGVTSLQIVADFYGKYYPESYLSSICKSTSEGVSLLGINEAANAIGFRTICAKMVPEDISKGIMPCILHWNQNHFVVLYKVR